MTLAADVRDPGGASQPVRRWRGPSRNARLAAGLLLLAILAVAAILAPLIAPYEPGLYDLEAILQPPSLAHPFGTDEIGRDVLSRVIWGGRPVMIVVVLSTLLSLVIGLVLGFAASASPVANAALSRLADIQLSIPSLVFALLAIAFAGSRIGNLVVVLALAAWPLHFRVVKAHALTVRRLPFHEASQLAGSSPLYTFRRNVLPGVLPIVAVTTSVTATVTALSAAGLSYLGLGVQEPDWGRMIAVSKGHLSDALWASGFPALALVAFLFGVQLVADSVSDRVKDSGGSRNERT